MKTTQYFRYTRRRPDRAMIKDEWIEQVIRDPLRVILLEDGETVHNAFLTGVLRSRQCV